MLYLLCDLVQHSLYSRVQFVLGRPEACYVVGLRFSRSHNFFAVAVTVLANAAIVLFGMRVALLVSLRSLGGVSRNKKSLTRSLGAGGLLIFHFLQVATKVCDFHVKFPVR